MRCVRLLLFSVALTLSAVAADVKFVRVWPQWRNAEAFDRITEYFGGGENDGRETVLRTHADQRAGMYFLVRVKTSAAVEHAQFALTVIRPDAPEPKTYTFPVSVGAKGGVFELGLTGADWPGGRDAHPVAWKLTLVDSSRQPLVSEKSFLWADQ